MSFGVDPNVRIWDGYFTSQAAGRVQWCNQGNADSDILSRMVAYPDESWTIKFNICNVGEGGALCFADLTTADEAASEREFWNAFLGGNTATQLMSFSRSGALALQLHGGYRNVSDDSNVWTDVKQFYVTVQSRPDTTVGPPAPSPPSGSSEKPGIRVQDVYFTSQVHGRIQLFSAGSRTGLVAQFYPDELWTIEFNIGNTGPGSAYQAFATVRAPGVDPNGYRESFNFQLDPGYVTNLASFSGNSPGSSVIWAGYSNGPNDVMYWADHQQFDVGVIQHSRPTPTPTPTPKPNPVLGGGPGDTRGKPPIQFLFWNFPFLNALLGRQ